MAAAEEKECNVLILGGCGFIGRNLVKYLVDNRLGGKIRVADKTQPIVAGLNAAHTAAFADPRVEFKQADLTKNPHVQRAFADDKFDYVVNLCGETRFGLNEEEYKSKCLDTATNCAAAAKAQGCSKWVEVSTGQIYNPDKKPADEEGKASPWTTVAAYRYKAEDAVVASGVPAVILRPVYVYGSGDLTGLSPRITCAAHYKADPKQNPMKFLWGKDLKLHVVHVVDVVAAIWTSLQEGKPGAIYNLADNTDLDQGALNEMLGNIFKIKTAFYGAMMSNLAKLKLKDVAQEANDTHVPGWTKLCQTHGIANTPLSPYIDVELLKNQHLSVNGQRITRETSFKYSVPRCTEATIRAQIQEFIDNKQFPPII